MSEQPPAVPLDGTARPEAVFEALELAIRRRLPGRLHGDQQGLRLGSGSSPEEVVRYRPGEDDVRRIDWNVTARAAGDPHVWRPLAEHELEAWVLVDATPSMQFGTAHLEKQHVATGVVAAISLLTAGPGNRVGTAHLTTHGLEWSQPLPSRAAAHRALRRPFPERPGPTRGRAPAEAVGRVPLPAVVGEPRPAAELEARAPGQPGLMQRLERRLRAKTRRPRKKTRLP